MRSMNIKGRIPLFFASLVIGLKLRHLLEKAWKQKSVSFFLDKNKNCIDFFFATVSASM